MPFWLAAAVRAITKLNRWIFLSVVWLMAIVVPVLLFEIVSRYVFHAPTTWGLELAIMLFGPYFLLGGPYLLHLKGHVTLDLLKQRFSAAAQRRIDLVNFPMIIIFCGILLYYSAPSAWSSWSFRETSFTAWNPPIWPVKACVPIALVLMLLQAIAEFIGLLFNEPLTDVPLDSDVKEVQP